MDHSHAKNGSEQTAETDLGMQTPSRKVRGYICLMTPVVAARKTIME
jgi:hypothetical protein